MATAPSPNELTRQQLDELDGLLQRMLALPLNPPDTPPPAAKAPELPPPALPVVAPNWRVDPPAAPAPHLLLAANALPLPDPVVERIPEPERAPEPPPVVPTRVRGPVPPPEWVAANATPVPQTRPEPRGGEHLVAPRVSEEPEPVAPPKYAAGVQPPATGIAPPTPWSLVPLVAVNRLTDAVLGLLGPLGKVARSGFGRNVFGVAGLLLIAYTGVRVAQVSGLLALPFPLPWPR